MSLVIYKWGWGDESGSAAFWGWIGNGPVVFPRNAFVPSIVKDSHVPSIVKDSYVPSIVKDSNRIKIVI